MVLVRRQSVQCHEQWTVELTNLTDHHKFTSTVTPSIYYFYTSEKSELSLQNIQISAVIKLADKSGYRDNGYPDLETLPLNDSR